PGYVQPAMGWATPPATMAPPPREASYNYFQSHGAATQGYGCFGGATPGPVASSPVPTAAPTPASVTVATDSTGNTLRAFERGGSGPVTRGTAPAADSAAPYMESGEAANKPTPPLAQTGKEGVELALQLKALENGERFDNAKTCQVGGKTCHEVN